MAEDISSASTIQSLPRYGIRGIGWSDVTKYDRILGQRNVGIFLNILSKFVQCFYNTITLLFEISRKCTSLFHTRVYSLRYLGDSKSRLDMKFI